MEVYLVPVGADLYALYSEVPEDSPELASDAPKGLWKRLHERFQTVLAAIEREHGQGQGEAPEASTPLTWFGRVRNRVLRWTAERIAEQRLLWHLRGQVEARVVAPDDLPGERARDIVGSILRHDANRHRLWLIVNGIAFIVSGLLAPIPGPNVVAYYFAFRSVGHYLSMLGARHGLSGVSWQVSLSAGLTRLRTLSGLPSSERKHQVDEIARELGLNHLAKFFARTAVPVA